MRESQRPGPFRHIGPELRVVWAAAGVCLVAGCNDAGGPLHPLAVITAELDAAVAGAATGVNAGRIRELLAHELPEVRAMAAQAAAAAGDWESMPSLITLIEDEEQVVAARAAAACATLLGMDHGHDPKATPAERAKTRESISRAYEAMKQNPPPQYRK